MSRGLPNHALSTWKDRVGRLHQKELSDTRLFLWASTPSQQPHMVDGENESLRVRDYQLYPRIPLAVPYFSSGRVTSRSGANADGTTRVRSLTW